MAERIEPFDVTVAAGVSSSNPTTVETRFADGIVTQLEIDVPPGPSGLVGFKVLNSGQVIIPRSSGVWVVADNVQFRWPLERYITSGRWAFLLYNVGQFSHTLRVRYLINDLPAPAPQPIRLIPIG